MKRKPSVVLLIFILAIFLSGCATARRQKDLQVQGLRNQLSVLEAQLQAKDQEINSLKESVDRAKEGKTADIRTVGEVKSRPTARQIQLALKNAGYNPGAIDGRLGRQSRDAVRSFQKANNLPEDGKVGKKTWELLQGYLYRKVK